LRFEIIVEEEEEVHKTQLAIKLILDLV